MLVLVLLLVSTAACAALFEEQAGSPETVVPSSTPLPSPETPSESSLPVSPLPERTAEPTPTPTPSPSPSIELPPAPERWAPPAGEPAGLVAIKQVAADAVQRLTTYDPGTDPADIARSVVTEPDLVTITAAVAGPLMRDNSDWSRGRIIYPQMGGIQGRDASVMVVVQQLWGSGAVEDAQTESRTVDVRLRRQDDGVWRVVGIASVGGEPVRRPSDLDELAVAVLDHPNIRMPDSARWDIYAGRVSANLLELMRDMAETEPYTIAVLSTGHPFHVFDTASQSSHTAGRAVDVWRFGEVTVAADRGDGGVGQARARRIWEDQRVRNLGSPWNFDPPNQRSFTDLTHLDHFHITVPAEG